MKNSLTKEELIEAIQKALPEEKQYELVYEALEKQRYFILKELNQLDKRLEQLEVIKHREKRNDEEFYEILKKRKPLSGKIMDIMKKLNEVQYMRYHRKRYPNDNRTYKEIIQEGKEKREKESKEQMKKYFEEMERKYG